MLERAHKEGYAVFQNCISPGTAAKILAVDKDASGWVRIFLKEKEDDFFPSADADPPASPNADTTTTVDPAEAPADDEDRIELEMDDYRLMRDIPENIITDLEDVLGEIWRWIYPNHVAENWVVLKSLSGGERQALHTDYRLWEHKSGGRAADRLLVLDYNRVPATLLLALQPKTKIHFYGWNRYVADIDDRSTTITLDAGDVEFFRGDMIHA